VIANWRDIDHPKAGGAEDVCEQLARWFARRDWDVVLLSSSVPGRPRTERREGVTVVRHGGRYTVYLRTLAWLLLHRRSIRAVIDSQNGIPFFAPLVTGPRIPVVLLLHQVHRDLFRHYFGPAQARVGQWLESTGTRLVYRDRAVVAVSPSTRQGARRVFRLKGEIFVVPPGCQAVGQEAPESRRRSPHERLVWVGRLVPQKRIDMLLEALPLLAEEFPAVDLHLVGDGPMRPELERQVTRLGIADRVVFHGALAPAERDAILRTGWLSVTASESEGWGPGVVEANAQGVPVLAFRRPGLRDAIRQEETGWLLDEGAPLGPAVADVLRRLADRTFADAIGVRAQRWVARFTWEEMAQQVSSILLAEEGRLEHPREDRRTRSDLSSVAVVPFEVIPEGVVLRFRPTDRTFVGSGGQVVLLRGTDTEMAHVALRRAGLPDRAVAHPDVRIDVARPADLVSPESSLGCTSPGSGPGAPTIMVDGHGGSGAADEPEPTAGGDPACV
jgi:glycosyltransferase involved in cell wall biosynthesis